MSLVPLIMAGGTGSRLWPLSRQLNPKQFLTLTGEQSMLQETLARLDGLEHADPVVVCNEEHRFIVAEQLRQGGVESAAILLEPLGRNTAPAIALGALHAMAHGDDPVLMVMAADHRIADVEAFDAAIHAARPLAEAGQLVTFGIVPTHAETGYGYIQRGEAVDGGDGYAVERFVEKPDAATAEAWLAGGEHYWNSGMFMFRAGCYLAELERLQPAMVASCRAALAEGERDMEFVRLGRESFTACPAGSVDYAVMEHTQPVVVPLDAGWSDIGSWKALWEVSPKDANGNAIHGDVLTDTSRNCLVHAEHRLVATLGIDDLVIVETKDAVLVAHRERVQEVKRLVERLRECERSEHLDHREVYRPWGCYDSIDAGQRFQVKRITVKPGARLSVQMHHHRAEHWVVVSGTARVTNGEQTYLVSENESTFIPVGHVHSLENPGKIPLELVEVQSGAYLGEDDIVRFEDQYGRASSVY
ncbi:mannose-1-phosphate guanylyltransferase/mannose-6-phosphate isomerase [Thioalkalivibrio sp. AKL10]|uniref:mannose-1-phosphate guanylyltransferase/mannose-6-phosphate isomerase n=1 Tax=Thioalkalivibrio sp. AKL10 TaxID=1158158 RepID=UPI00037F5F99|nr:mannose-1-phosphate guanylyltransferase/mannose-6-phosphate isomerase [Thioalkalivibrio sp. AKL10]